VDLSQLACCSTCGNLTLLDTAGTKDKRGVTTQYVTLLRTAPAKLAALNSK